jgi:hypothetical protein
LRNKVKNKKNNMQEGGDFSGQVRENADELVYLSDM